MSRHDSRRIAIQAIFLANGEPDLIIEQMETKVTKSLDLKVIPAYTHEITTGVLAKKSETEVGTSKYLRKGWRLERVNRISVVIIKVVIFEINQSDAISAPAAVDEALIPCEEPDDPKSKSFINRILTNFMPSKQLIPTFAGTFC